MVPMDAVADVDRSDLIGALAALDADFAQRVAEAARRDEVLRYVARVEGSDCRVTIEAVPRSKPLGAIRDGENALVIHTHYYQPIPMVLRGYGAGAAVTAAGVFGDLLRTVWRPLDN
jgi:aspartokinase/homoserine dehydrogenase 1